MPSTTSNIHENLNENNDIKIKELLTANKYYSTNSDVHDKPANNIQTELVSIPHTINKMVKNISVDEDTW